MCNNHGCIIFHITYSCQYKITQLAISYTVVFTWATKQQLLSLSLNDGWDTMARDIIPIPRSITFSRAINKHCTISSCLELAINIILAYIAEHEITVSHLKWSPVQFPIWSDYWFHLIYNLPSICLPLDMCLSL